MNSNNLPENVGTSDSPIALSSDAPVPVRRQVQNIESRPESSQGNVNKIDEAGITLGMKMYINPIRDIVPLQIDNMPLQTERVFTEREIHNFIFSPVIWCEPLRVFRWQFNERPVNNIAPVLYNHSIIDLAHFTIDVSYVQRAEQHTPALSTLATTLRAYMGTDAVTASCTALRSFQPQRNLRDIQSLAAIVERLPSSPASYYDEAPFLRCLLLMNTMASANYFQCHSAIAQQTFMNLRPTGAPVVAWSVTRGQCSRKTKPCVSQWHCEHGGNMFRYIHKVATRKPSQRARQLDQHNPRYVYGSPSPIQLDVSGVADRIHYVFHNNCMVEVLSHSHVPGNTCPTDRGTISRHTVAVRGRCLHKRNHGQIR